MTVRCHVRPTPAPPSITVSEFAEALNWSYSKARYQLATANLLNWQPGETRPVRIQLSDIRQKLPALGELLDSLFLPPS